MDSFIEEVVASLIDQGLAVEEYLFIVPSRRAGGRLRAALSRKLKKTIFAPEIYSTEEFISHISGLKAIDQTEQLFTLFEAYKSCTTHDQQESFATFYGWAQTILYDFNEIDRYLVDHNQFFNYLSAVQELNHWSVGTAQTELIRKYLAFWNSLPVLYTLFCERLEKMNKGHQGLMYRRAAETISQYLQNNPKQQHVFIGFNALNTAEQRIIQALLSAQQAVIYWDAETWFMDRDKHEASLFLRKYRKDWNYYENNTFSQISSNYTQTKKVRTTAVAQDIEQAKLVGQLLSQYDPKMLQGTAVVLNDERLLLPILNALPENVTKVNITMGIPLRDTPCAPFFEQLFIVHTNISERGYYYKEIFALLQDQMVRQILGEQGQELIDAMIAENQVYFRASQIKQLILEKTGNKAVASLFSSWEDTPATAINVCLAFIEMMKEQFLKTGEQQLLSLEYLFGFYKVFNQLNTLNDIYAYLDDIVTLKRFYMDIISGHTLDLRGDPYEGLQIMGMLESRLLDFETIIMTSVNEGVLPAGKSTNSYISYDLKQAYDLPTHREKDAMYAYHFYRLLHRARQVDLIYTTASKGLGSQEKSRFLLQMELEGPHVIDSQVATSAFEVAQKRIKQIEKTPEIISRLREIGLRGFSPSSLTTYIRNPIDFYYKYVLCIKETDDVEETVAANTMGTIVHNTLEELYKPFVDVLLTIELLDTLFPNIEKEVRRQFQKEYGLSNVAQGKNLIIYEVVLRYVENYLNQEKDRIAAGDVVIVRGLEAQLQVSFRENINLGGKVDLIEERNGATRIIDYKTGKVENRHLSPAHWEELLDPTGSYEKAFQVLMYAYMMHKDIGLSFPIEAGIISFKNLKAGFLPFKKDKTTAITEDTLSAFAKILDHLISEIFNPELPFMEPKE